MRNDSALFMQATFEVEGRTTRLILSADVGYEVIQDIVRVTKQHGNEHRLEWEVNNVPHHSSFHSLASEKGEDVTDPPDDIRWLYEDQGQVKALLVSTSRVIPSNDDDDQPPHRQAANYYRDVASNLGGSYIVTMEHPTISKPKPLIIEIGAKGCTVLKAVGGTAAVISTAAPRAGT